MTRKQRRLVLIGGSGVVLAVAVGLVLSAMSNSIVFFRSPSEIATEHLAPGTRVRIGGLVETGSVKRSGNLNISFKVTDGDHAIAVRYQGLVPDLFREGQGIIANGKLLPNGTFKANEVLAKHDENYMPPEVADAIKKAGGVVPTNHLRKY